MGRVSYFLDILRNSFIQCGLVSADTREYHNQLRQNGQNRTLLYDLTDISAFNPGSHEESKEGYYELMDSGEDLMDIQSEDEDKN